MEVVKSQAKRMGLTQAHLADRLGVSLPTIKRWYQGDFVTLANLKKICDEIGLTLADIFTDAEGSASRRFQYSLEQESYFADNVAVLAYFDLLLKGLTPREIERRTGTRKSASYLAQLERLKLIKWLKADRVEILVKGEPAWRPNGPLAKTLTPKIKDAFFSSLDAKSSKFALHSYLPDDLERLKVKLAEVSDFASTANRRSQLNAEKAIPHGLYFAVSQFDWHLEKALKP